MAHLQIAASALHLEPLGPIHPYRFRHTGASHDFVSQTRPLEVQRRGRWRDKRSVLRYEKGGRLGQLFNRLSRPVQQHALECVNAVNAVVLGRRSALTPP